MKKAIFIKETKNSSNAKDNFTLGKTYEFETSDLLHIMPTIPYKFYADDDVIVYLPEDILRGQFQIIQEQL